MDKKGTTLGLQARLVLKIIRQGHDVKFHYIHDKRVEAVWHQANATVRTRVLPEEAEILKKEMEDGFQKNSTKIR